MSNVNELVKKAVGQHNENLQKDAETKVSQLVRNILYAESDIQSLKKKHEEEVDGIKKKIVEYKEELKKLEMPTPVSLEL